MLSIPSVLPLARRAGAELRALGHCARAGMIGWVPPAELPDLLRAAGAHGQLGLVLALGGAGNGDRPAVIDERGTLTYSELRMSTNALANSLADKGVSARSTIAVLCRNHRGILQAIFAAAKLGARILLLNTDFAGPQAYDVCTRESVDLVIRDEEFADRLGGYDPPLGQLLAWTESSAAATVDELIAAGSTAPLPRPKRQSRLVLLTSGTTGTPKGAPRTVSRTLTLPGGILAKIPYRARKSVVVAAPIFHGWGLLNAQLNIALGNTLVLRRRFDPAATLDLVQRHEADGLAVVPIMLARILQLGSADLAARELGSLRIIASAGSVLPETVCARATEIFGDVVHNFYGSTEVAYATIATPADLAAAPGTVGRPPLAVEVRILDHQGHSLPSGESGRIFVRNISQFAGYSGGGGGKEIHEGFMSTGDVGWLDSAGRLFVDGRDDDMIVSGGENVFPGEVEELLLTHSTVADVAVTGVADAEYGQRLAAYVVPSGDAVIDADVLREFVKANLARFKVPRDIHPVTELPRNQAGKVRKNALTPEK